MNGLEISLSIISALGLTGTTLLGVLFHRAENKRIKIAEADKAEAEAHQQEWSLEHQRLDESHKTIMTLNEIIKTQGETISRNNRALDDKTTRIREAQDREFKTNKEKMKLSRDFANLIKENGALKLRLQKHECIVQNCERRDPPLKLVNEKE